MPTTVNPDGSLTKFGVSRVSLYAKEWVGARERDLDAERRYPTLTEAFWQVRMDPEYARDMAGTVQKSLLLVIPFGGQ